MVAELDRKSILLSADGGTLEIVSHDGEHLATVAVPPGRVPAARYLDLIPDGGFLRVGDGIAVTQARSRIGIQPYGAASHDSGANPDFRPTSATRMERELRLTLSRMQQATARVEARERALAKIERVPHAPVPVPPAPVPVPPAPAPVDPALAPVEPAPQPVVGAVKAVE